MNGHFRRHEQEVTVEDANADTCRYAEVRTQLAKQA
jgi:hypothetical protein